MLLEHEFVVSVPPAVAWDVLLDIKRVAPCMPGVTLGEVEGDSFSGKVKIKVGPITVSYKGRAQFIEKDPAARRVVVRADGREERGAGTAGATVTAQLHDAGNGRTRVHVQTDLAITGKPAQFSRGVLTEVGSALIDQFVARLERQIALETDNPPAAAAAPADTDTDRKTQPATPSSQEGAGSGPGVGGDNAALSSADDSAGVLDLGPVAWRPVLKRVAPAAAVLLALLMLIRLGRRRRD